jgi:hypothetical protein
MNRLRIVRLTGMLLLCTLAVPRLAHAQDDEFKRGIDALTDKPARWQEVAKEMRAAIQKNGTESSRTVKTGGFLGIKSDLRPYLPHYFLGEALYRTGDCVGAVTEWVISEQQGAIKTQAEYLNAIQEGYKACSAKGVLSPSEFNPLAATAGRQLSDALAHAQRVAALRDSRQDLWRPEMNEQFDHAQSDLRTGQTRMSSATRTRAAADFNEARASADRATAVLNTLERTINEAIVSITAVQAQGREVDALIQQAEAADRGIDNSKVSLSAGMASSRQGARDQLGRGRDRLREGVSNRSLAAVNEALKYVQDAKGTLSGLLDQVNKTARENQAKQFADASAQATELLAFIDNSYTTASTLATEQREKVTQQMADELESIQKQSATVHRRFESARRSQDLSAVTDVVRVTSELRASLDAFIKQIDPDIVHRGVPQALKEASQQFFAGDYQRVLATLDPAAVRDAPMQAHIHAFRAAALYTLYVRSGDQDQSLRTRALTEVQLSKQFDASFQPDSRVFAPRFITFYQNGGASASTSRAATARP